MDERPAPAVSGLFHILSGRPLIHVGPVRQTLTLRFAVMQEPAAVAVQTFLVVAGYLVGEDIGRQERQILHAHAERTARHQDTEEQRLENG